jgi:eukaryotic-like serine/threonine-protein kinase
VGQHNGSPFLVSELLEGESLRDVLDCGALPQRKAIDYSVQIAQGLAIAHAKEIIDRDLKPENLFLTRDGRLKILDFGLAKALQKTAARVRIRTGLRKHLGRVAMNPTLFDISVEPNGSL